MNTTLYTTRKYNGEEYKFFLNTPSFDGEKGCCGIELSPYISVETPDNGLGYPDTVIYDEIRKQAYTLNRYLAPWILRKIEQVARKILVKF